MALVDWDLAISTAARLGPTGPTVSMGEATSVVAQLRVLASEAEGHVAAYTGLTPVLDDGGVKVVDRPTWAAVNVAGLKSVINPLADKLLRKTPQVASAVGSKIAGVQAGALLAYLSGKVLGQYDVFERDPGQLLLVAPNVVAVERKLRVDPHDFRLWVCIHEMTHRTQFTAVPWLRGHFLSEVRAYIDAAEPSGQLMRAASRIFDVARGHEGASLLDVVQTPEQKVILDRLTCILTLLEGHAEFVMDGVGPDVIGSVAQIRASFDRRRNAASPLEQYLRRLFGMDIKLKQYAQGRKFVSHVVDEVGMERFNKVFTSPETVPLIGELPDPGAWITRVAP
ncbi:MAG TPA: zinc-dependent metalloprotease [Candidatus Limnocylindrales bacterium]|nr:zinc-dependent metalloprotease [Candidatus Limnocylindrales bacterium]